MIQLQTKEFFVKSVESDIEVLKSNVSHFEAAKRQLKLITEISHRQDREYQDVYSWLIKSLNEETEQREVNFLTVDQTKYAMGVISAITDVVTMVI